MPSSKNTVILVVISFLLLILIYSSVTKWDVFANLTKTPPACSETKGESICCITYTWTDSSGRITDIQTRCTTCSLDSSGHVISCTTTITHTNGQTGLPGRLGALPTGNNTGGITNGQTGPPSRLGNALPPTNNMGALPALTITKEHNLASPKILNSRQATTCPNGLPPGANGNCPTTTTTNQQDGSAQNNNPQQGHHHKGSNQPTQIAGGGGQELTATKKHKGSKTDQGTITQPPS